MTPWTNFILPLYTPCSHRLINPQPTQWPLHNQSTLSSVQGPWPPIITTTTNKNKTLEPPAAPRVSAATAVAGRLRKLPRLPSLLYHCRHTSLPTSPTRTERARPQSQVWNGTPNHDAVIRSQDKYCNSQSSFTYFGPSVAIVRKEMKKKCISHYIYTATLLYLWSILHSSCVVAKLLHVQNEQLMGKRPQKAHKTFAMSYGKSVFLFLFSGFNTFFFSYTSCFSKKQIDMLLNCNRRETLLFITTWDVSQHAFFTSR